MVTFFSSLTSGARGTWLVKLSLVSLVLSVLGGLVAQYILLAYIDRWVEIWGSAKHNADRIATAVSWLGFLVGLVVLALYAILNL
jgi:hypothetical protein